MIARTELTDRLTITCKLLLATVVAPSVLLFVLSLRFGFVPFLIDLDLLLVYVTIVWLARWRQPVLAAWIGSALVILVSVVPILRGLGMVYIADPALILSYLGFWRLWPWSAFLGVFVTLAIVFLGLSFLLHRLETSQARILPAVLLLVAAQLVDAAGGSSRFGPGFVSLGINVSTSSAYQLYAIGRQIAYTPRFKVVAQLPSSAMAQVLANPAPRVLSVAVESWGWFKDEALNERILEGARAAAGRMLDLRMSRHDFIGGTLSGELRELCGLLSRGVPNVAEVTSLNGGCLPRRLRAMGYETFAAHGNQAGFYDRGRLYPALGFDRLMFQADFQRDRSSACPGAVFSGPCDRQVLGAAVRFLESHERAFAHVMTLDTHLPLKARNMADRDCADVPGTNDVATCIYVHRFSDVLRQIAELVRGSAVDQVFVYGDHAPPYVDGRSRDAFLGQQVPVLILQRSSAAL